MARTVSHAICASISCLGACRADARHCPNRSATPSPRGEGRRVPPLDCKERRRLPGFARQTPRAPNRLRTEYFRRVPSSARRDDDNCCSQFEEARQSDAPEIGEKTTGATCSVLQCRPPEVPSGLAGGRHAPPLPQKVWLLGVPSPRGLGLAERFGQCLAFARHAPGRRRGIGFGGEPKRTESTQWTQSA